MITIMAAGGSFWRVASILSTMVAIYSCAATWTPPADLSYHCWPSFATGETALPFPTCVGINASWTTPPPDNAGSENVDIAFRIQVVGADFYPWAVAVGRHDEFKRNFFKGVAGMNFSTPVSAAETWCRRACPTASVDTTSVQCCLHGVGVRVCRLDYEGQIPVPCDGTVFPATPTNGQRKIDSEDWTSTLTVQDTPGRWAVVVHFEIGEMVMTLSEAMAVPSGIIGASTWIIVMAVALVSVGIVGLAAIVAYHLRKGRVVSVTGMEKITVTDWNIKSEDLGEDHSHKHGIFGSNTSIVAPFTDDVVSKRHNFVCTAVYGKFGQVAVRKIRKSYLDVDEELRRELTRTVHVVHINVCRIYGVVIELDNVCIVSEFCQKHGLNDILATEEIPLTWDFRLHFGQDICHGMEYLHLKKIYHGRLKTSNCLVDEKWMVKVSDWGLSTIRAEDPNPDQLSALKRHAADRIYRSPEHSDMFDQVPDAQGDVYSFGIVLTEIATRKPPNGDRDPEKMSPYWKPAPPNLNSPPAEDEDVCPCCWEYLDMIDECLQDVPSLRPTFERLTSVLNRLYPSRQNPLQISVSMLERYSRSLEAVVAEKIQACEEERHRVIKLMSNFAPPCMVEKLYNGMVPCAKGYGLCTVYFSDIVGFTNIASLSAPCEVVATLNQLYHTLNEVIRRYDALTVELITDAYLIVSGLPLPNHNHALELARMSLDMIAACKAFVIPHRASEKIKIRIGLHSGPLAGGIVGINVPKFCVFGETINVASKMGSTGKANRIHVSEFTYDLLMYSAADEFQFERRGTVPFKGRQEMTTWWLTAKHDESMAQDSMASVGSMILPGSESSEVIITNDDIAGRSHNLIGGASNVVV